VAGTALSALKMLQELLYPHSKSDRSCPSRIQNVAGTALSRFKMWQELPYPHSKCYRSCPSRIQNVAGASLAAFKLWKEFHEGWGDVGVGGVAGKRQELTIYSPVIYTAPCVKCLMRASPLRGVGPGP
jgi:hypothetical protein